MKIKNNEVYYYKVIELMSDSKNTPRNHGRSKTKTSMRII